MTRKYVQMRVRLAQARVQAGEARDAGQGSLEYIGAILIAAVIIGLVIAGINGANITGAVTGAITGLFTSAGGGAG